MKNDSDQEIENMLLPVYVKDLAVVGKGDVPQIYSATCIQASNGDVISLSIPKSWARYIVDKLNSKKLEDKINEGKLLARIVIQSDPPLYSQSRAVVESVDGTLRIKRSKELTDYIKRFDRNFSKFVKTRHNFPITEKCNIKATFHVSVYSHATLAELIHPLETTLYEVGIFDLQSYNIIKSWDGSRIVYEDPSVKPYTDLVIRRSHG